MCAARGGVPAADGDDRPPEFITKLYRMLLVRTQCVYSVVTRPMNRARLLLPPTHERAINRSIPQDEPDHVITWSDGARPSSDNIRC